MLGARRQRRDGILASFVLQEGGERLSGESNGRSFEVCWNNGLIVVLVLFELDGSFVCTVAGYLLVGSTLLITDIPLR